MTNANEWRGRELNFFHILPVLIEDAPRLLSLSLSLTHTHTHRVSRYLSVSLSNFLSLSSILPDIPISLSPLQVRIYGLFRGPHTRLDRFPVSVVNFIPQERACIDILLFVLPLDRISLDMAFVSLSFSPFKPAKARHLLIAFIVASSPAPPSYHFWFQPRQCHQTLLFASPLIS